MCRTAKAGALALAALVLLAGAASGAWAQRGWLNVSRELAAAHKAKVAVVTVLAAAPGADQVVVGFDQLGLWATTDGGLSWRPLGTPGQLKLLPVQILFDPRQPLTFWVSGMHGPGLFKTTDGGSTFTALGTLSNCEGIGVDLSDEYRRTLVIAMHERVKGVQRSVSSGRTWQDIGDTIPRGSNYATIPWVFDAETYILHTVGIGAPNPGIYRTADAGRSWIRVSSYGTRTPGLVASDGSVYYPPDGAVYLPDSQTGRLIRSDDKGLTWRQLAPPALIAPVELPDRRIVSAAGRQLYVSSDRGASWERFGPPAMANIRAIAYNSARRQIFAVLHTPTPPLNTSLWKIGTDH